MPSFFIGEKSAGMQAEALGGLARGDFLNLEKDGSELEPSCAIRFGARWGKMSESELTPIAVDERSDTTGCADADSIAPRRGGTQTTG